LQFAGEELFKLATVHMLFQDNRKAENALDEAAQLFKKSGEIEPAFKRESVKYVSTCKATKKLVQAQIVFNTGNKVKAMRLVEQAEKEMVQANARWREVWLIRGFRELILGNLEEAKNNLVRVVKESLDVVDDKNPTSTGHTAKKLVSLIDEEGKTKKRLPPAAIDLPLRSESIVAADRLDRFSKKLSSVTSLEASEEKKVNVDEIREMVKKIMGIEDRKEMKKERERN
jgi:tetratricopeptide (TPR) repeat protein